MTERLKPCPFCGGVAVEGRNDWCVFITCSECGCYTSPFIGEDKEKAVQEAWNRRARDE